MLLPLADVIVVERRVCRACGAAYIAPSPHIFRLMATPFGEMRKLSLHRRKSDGTDPSVNITSTHYLNSEVDHCILCWEPSMKWEEVTLLYPEPPPKLEVPQEVLRAFGLTSPRAAPAPNPPKPIRSLPPKPKPLIRAEDL